MAEISKITLPSGNTYDIKDTTARSMISGGVSYIIAWSGSSTPDITKIPLGVVVTYNDTNYTGTLSPEGIDAGSFYFVRNTGSSPNAYDEYISVGTVGSKYWEKLGTKDVDLSGLGDLAYKDSISVVKGDGDTVLGESTTFQNSSSSVTFTGGNTDTCLGTSATFTTTVTPSTTNIKATGSGVAVGANGTDIFVKSYPGTTSKLATTTIPNVTSAGSASNWSFAMGSGNDAETLIISGGNGSAPTLGTAITAATGSLDTNGGGDSVMTGLGTATTASALTGVKVTAQPTIALETGATAGAGIVEVATGITSASTSVNNADSVTVVTSIGTGTAAAQTITVGTNDKIKIVKYNDLGVSVS